MNAAKLLLLILLLSGCSAEKKAQRAATKEEARRQSYIQLLKDTRARFPCDTNKTKIITETLVKYLPGNTVYRNDTAFIVDTVIRERHIHTTNTIIDSAYTDQLINENASLKYGGQMVREQFDETVDKLAKEKKEKEEAISARNGWRKRAIGTWVILGLCTAGLVLMAYLKK